MRTPMRLKVAGAYWPGSARFATGPGNPIPPDKSRPVDWPRPRNAGTTSDPLCRAVHEHLVAADREAAPATFMLRHVLISVAAGRGRVVFPAASNVLVALRRGRLLCT